MKRTKRKLKTIALGVLVAAGMLLPCAASAQNFDNQGFGSSSGGFTNQSFGSSGNSGGFMNQSFGTSGSNSSFTNQSFGHMSESEGNITNQTFGGQREVPLGNGIMVLTALGAGYAVLRRRKNSL